jgi:DNA-binding NtrC family response regulator
MTEQKPISEHIPSGEQHLILIVDDNDKVRQALSHILSVEGFSLIEARSVGQACDALENKPISLLILDWFLRPGFPVPDEPALGSQVLKRCREVDQHLPVLVISGYGDVANVGADALMNGADAFMAKPFDTAALVRWVRLWKERQMEPFSLIDRAHTPTLEEVKTRYVHYIVRREGGEISRAAQILGINRGTVSKHCASKVCRVMEETRMGQTKQRRS